MAINNLMKFHIGIIIVLFLVVPAGAKDDVIILRLDDGQPKQQQPMASDTPQQQSIEQQPVIDVPATESRPASLPDMSKAASVVLMDAESGQILYSKNPHTKRPNASTTKIMTAILMIEHCGMQETITASKNASLTPFTSIHLVPGERISARDLLTGMLIRSANDAAVAVAEHVGGSVPKFASLMNKKACQIGCRDTHFVTPNGLYNKNHYSSAYDLCMMARYAFRYPLFNEIISTRKYFLTSRTKNKKDLAVIANSKFLKNYPGADGVKSGYIKQAGYCYVGSATRNGWRLVSAVLKSDNAGRDTTAVMNYGFDNFKPYTVARAGDACVKVKIVGGFKAEIPAAPAKDLIVAVPKTGGRIITRLNLKKLEAPISRGASVGTIIASVNGETVNSVELRAADDVGISIARRIWWLAKTCGFLIAGLMGVRYGTAVAKDSRRRRRRFATPLRSFNRYR